MAELAPPACRRNPHPVLRVEVPCAHCGAALPPGASSTRKFCSDDCRYRHRDERRSADPAWRERWRESSRARYAALSPAERAAYIARVRARQRKRAGQAGWGR